MKVIAIMSPKGGIGKTTTSDSIAYILGQEFERKVLVVDADPQADTSKIFGLYEADGVGMPEMLEKNISTGGKYRTKELIRKTDYENINIIPSNEYLMQTSMNLMDMREGLQISFKKSLKEIEGDYDYVICDCGRLLDLVVINILLAADLIIAPVKTGGFEIEALNNLKEQIENLNEELPIKVLITMRQKNKTAEALEDWLRTESEFDLYETVIRRSVVAEKSTIALKPLPKISRNGIATKDYRSVAKELVEDMENK